MIILRESAFWVGLIAVVCGFLVQQKVIPEAMSSLIQMMAVYVLGRLIGKGAKAVFPQP